MKNFKIIFIICFILSPYITNAGSMSFFVKNTSFTQGEEFTIEVILDTKGEYINAVEGDIVIPINILKIKSISDGGSLINFWIEKPSLSKEKIIHFAGITPGGFNGDKNLLFKIVAIGKKMGEDQIYIENIRTLKNDGFGSEIDTITTPADIKITDKVFDFFSFGNTIEDKELPESFNPFVASDPNLFNGKYFLNFVTQDKISGIDHYEVREGDWGLSIKAESPYLLTNQNLNVRIYVKAVDKAGNQRIEIIEPKNPPEKSENNFGIFFFIIFLILIILILFRKKIFKK